MSVAALYGLIGYPLTHSFSPGYFNSKFEREGINAVYKAFPLPDINDLPALIRNEPALAGLNVTIPYKQQVIAFLDELDEVAAEIRAVNCVDLRGGRLRGYNTDAAAFEQSLIPLLRSWHDHALVLGSGGVSKAVQYVLGKLGIRYLVISRDRREGGISYGEINDDIMQRFPLIINTTPVGMSPHMNEAPQIPYEFLTDRHLLFDLIYNPDETQFLAKGKAQGAAIKNGLEMLHLQAEESWRIWNANTAI
jgi:shikimate dehydrogenase